MILNSQNNQFIFNLPVELLSKKLSDKFSLLLEKNFIPYSNVLNYINSTIKEISFPSLTLDTKEQVLKRGKVVKWKDSKSVYDLFSNTVDITFRSVDSHLNYFILLEIIINYYLDTKNKQIPQMELLVTDKYGDVIYTIIFEEVLINSLSELRLGYSMFDISEKTFSLSFTYNFIRIYWEVSDKNTPAHSDILI